MEPLLSYLGWLILLVLIVFTLIYKKYSNDPHAVTSKYNNIQGLSDSGDLPQKVITALESAGFTNVSFDASEEKFYARTRVSMSSWGEQIIIKFVRRGQITDMEFISVCTFPFQIFDWGKNKRNYRKFMRELNKLTDRGGVQPFPIS